LVVDPWYLVFGFWEKLGEVTQTKLKERSLESVAGELRVGGFQVDAKAAPSKKQLQGISTRANNERHVTQLQLYQERCSNAE